MSTQGQANIKGVSDQAYITLYYLLESIQEYGFKQLIVEGKKWEDLCIVFNDHIEDYEVKSWSNTLKHNDLHDIIKKELKKELKEKDVLKIVTTKISKNLEIDYYSILSLPTWTVFFNKKPEEHPTVKKLRKKKWSCEEILFLFKVKLIEFEDISIIKNKIKEYFALKITLYLDEKRIFILIDKYFSKILSLGKSGGNITSDDFFKELNDFQNDLIKLSESFSSDHSLGKKFNNFTAKGFIKSKETFMELFSDKYIIPISSCPELIFYIVNKLKENDFDEKIIDPFLNKILIKNQYIILAFSILKNKKNKGLVSNKYLVDFIISNFKYLQRDLDINDALRILNKISKEDKNNFFREQIIKFLEEQILSPYENKYLPKYQYDKRKWREDELVSEIINNYISKSLLSEKHLDFIFRYFDFMGDDYANVKQTDNLIYSLLKEYIKKNFKINFNKIVKRITNQFDHIHEGRFKGYDLVGSGRSQFGYQHSICDKGIVRLLFTPLFMEIYNKNKNNGWRIIKNHVLNSKKIDKNNPCFLKRSVIIILLNRLELENLNKKQFELTYDYLKNILFIKQGIPNTSDIIFFLLKDRDFFKIGLDKIFNLVILDSCKYSNKNDKQKYPSSMFSIMIIIKLIEHNYKPAKEFLLNLIQSDDFYKYDNTYNVFEILSSYQIAENDPNFIIELLEKIDFEAYLNNISDNHVWDKSGMITGLLKNDLKNSTTKGEKIITAFLKNRVPSQKLLNLLDSPIRDLSNENAMYTYTIFKPYFITKKLFCKTFQNSPLIRTSFIRLSEELIKQKNYQEAKTIIEYVVEDVDPDTDFNDERNYHKKVKNGQIISIITSVRGQVCWALQKLVITNNKELMLYALNKTLLLLDFDGILFNKLKHSEPDLYVRLQALAPFTELAHYARRKILGKETNLLIKSIALKIIDFLDDIYEQQNIKLYSYFEYIPAIFSNMRDLNTIEAKKILSFFEKYEIEESSILFIYFSIFRKNHYKDIPFNSKQFEKKLSNLCKINNKMKIYIAHECAHILEDDIEKGTEHFNEVEKYWELLFYEYDKNVFDSLYRTFETSLKIPKYYYSHKELLKKAFKKQINYYNFSIQKESLWHPWTEVFKILIDNNKNDFLDVLSIVAKNYHKNIDYYPIGEWIEMYKNISPDNSQKKLYDCIEKKLKEFYPQYFLEVNK